MMESVEIESKRTNVGNNTKTYNRLKFDDGVLGLSFGSYISKISNWVECHKWNNNFKISKLVDFWSPQTTN